MRANKEERFQTPVRPKRAGGSNRVGRAPCAEETFTAQAYYETRNTTYFPVFRRDVTYACGLAGLVA